MRPKRYIGITGVTESWQGSAFLDLPLASDALVMIGVLASSATIHGGRNRWPMRYPQLGALRNVFAHHHRALNLVHFNTNVPERLGTELALAHRLIGEHCHGAQLNVPWPDVDTVINYRNATEASGVRRVVLQMGRAAMREVGNDPRQMAVRVMDQYRGVVDYVLIDPSGGAGEKFDVEFACECFGYLRDIPDLGFGVAGGLHAANMADQLRPLLLKFPDFSIDMEGRVRDERDELDISAATAALLAADALFAEYQG
jgi:hypothetical protein